MLQVKELNQTGCDAQAVQCDVSDEKQQQEAFHMHMEQFRRLDIAILNAGIGDTGQLELSLQPPCGRPLTRLTWHVSGDILNAQDKNWQKALDVDLTAVMVGTRLATQCMPSMSGGKIESLLPSPSRDCQACSASYNMTAASLYSLLWWIQLSYFAVP